MALGGMWPFLQTVGSARDALSLSLVRLLISHPYPPLSSAPSQTRESLSGWRLVMAGMRKAGRMLLEFPREVHVRHPKWLPASVATGQPFMPGALVCFWKVRSHDITLPFPSPRRGCVWGGRRQGVCLILQSRRRFGPCSWRKLSGHEYAICWDLHTLLFKRILINYSQGRFNMWPQAAPHDPVVKSAIRCQ